MRTGNKDNLLIVKRTDLLEEWDYTRNADAGIDVSMITCGSKKKAWWRCDVCHGEYQMRINHRTSGSGCPFCASKQVLPGFNDLASQNPELVKSEWDWDKNNCNNVKPYSVTAGSKKKVWWHCNTCGGKYEMRIKDKTSGVGCPFCAGKKILIGFNDLQSCYPDLASEWYQTMNGDIRPDMVSKGIETIRIPDPANPKRVISVKPAWKCKKCSHIWLSTVGDRTNKGGGCPKCAEHYHISRQENQVADYINNYLCEHYDMNYTMRRSIKFKRIYKMLGIDAENVLTDGLQSHLRKELDIYIPELNLAIEYDGDYWHDDNVMLAQRGLTNDEAHEIKQELCRQAGIELFFITEHEWLHDTDNVKQMLTRIIDDKMHEYKEPR